MIIYTTGLDTPLGAMEITATDKGITGIFYSKEKTSPSAGRHPHLQAAVQQLNAYFRGKRLTFDLPLVYPPTVAPFTQRVWREMQDIPPGKTVSYGALAKKAGNGMAARACGRACHDNPFAIIVPCHRVVGSSGKLTGYAGGLPRKEWLLNHEKVANV